MKVLVINYSQTGQLDKILDRMVGGLGDWEVDRIRLKMEKPYPFPWNRTEFFNVMPNAVLEVPSPIINPEFAEENYDLIILGYQPWFLSPSIPTNSLLEHEGFAQLLKGTKVITVIGARNMWLNAQMAMVRIIEQKGGRLIGNIPFVDRSPNLAGAISIVHWLIRGKKERRFGIFPMPGISKDEINSANIFGEIIAKFANEDGALLQDQILETKRISIRTNILITERRAKRIFQIWAGIINRKGTSEKKRKRWLNIFRIYLNFALYVLSPIILIIFFCLIYPFTFLAVKKQKRHFLYLGINKSSSDG